MSFIKIALGLIGVVAAFIAVKWVFSFLSFMMSVLMILGVMTLGIFVIKNLLK